ncbi:MAG: phenylphosphate carboxylase subunit delta [Planctomycetaceae bacterium]|nr:phenylphosphate carboxylase subunit delta [Planctomycetaceae bacterium]|tara:strand:+ start:205 stop:735 length:531 start_codon:yes stop_codon:yes gene_type:complete
MSFDQQANNISLILSDVDGVLTDGGIIFDNEGIETKRFHIRDGLGIKLWQRAGMHFGIVTGRSSNVVQIRAKELGVKIVRQGFEEKLPVVHDIISDLTLSPDQVCYIGDDLPDIPVMQYVGLPVAVADAAIDVRNAAAYISESRGGQGAVREVIERILRIQDRWAESLHRFSSNAP